MADQKSCPLLDIPPELRNTIYDELLLGDDKAVRVSDRTRRPWHAPAILQTCALIRSEASAIYYSTNAFEVSIDPNNLGRTLCAWLKGLGPQRCGMLQQIRLGLIYGEGYGPTISNTMRACRGLEMFDEMVTVAGCRIREGALRVQVPLTVERHDDDNSERYEWVGRLQISSRLGGAEG
ncbi:hypothetical protein LTR56_019936 [Elasticomyces elasticus]|nr:hypothetical protein LTR56_019936 [Elasticomyces elasticus]KAK3643377.1 hypothetical protein LTR22_015680 [Elasticomyces elasticus]KAK4914005.1 hypothetical protein LTR49_017719 [Elasticomyces elasticus]KAK5755484.1 hypothetical protein LTS12_014469 [Elasticomyces elasticus]